MKNRNICPHCGKRISLWKKWLLTDKAHEKTCDSCGKVIAISNIFRNLIMWSNLMIAIGVVLFAKTTEIILFTVFLAVLLNVLIISLISIIKKEDN